MLENGGKPVSGDSPIPLVVWNPELQNIVPIIVRARLNVQVNRELVSFPESQTTGDEMICLQCAT